jgi:hypothetical protein
MPDFENHITLNNDRTDLEQARIDQACEDEREEVLEQVQRILKHGAINEVILNRTRSEWLNFYLDELSEDELLINVLNNKGDALEQFKQRVENIIMRHLGFEE